MASEQARRENVVKERELQVEKGRDSGVHVTHAAMERGRHDHESSGGGRIHGGGGAPAAVFGQEGPGRVGVELTGEGPEELDSGAHGFHGEKARHAQLLAAGGEEIRERKGQVSVLGGGGRSATDYVTEMGRETGHVASQKGKEAKEQAVSVKDTAAEKAKRASEFATEKGSETGNTAAEKAARAKDYTLQKAVEAKDIAAEKSQRASQYLTEKGKETGNLTAQKGQEAKEQTVSITGKAKEYTVQKAGEAMEMSKEAAEYAKETVVEGGKEAAHYAGVAAEKAAGVGWTAAHFTTEKVVQGTKAVAGTVEGAVGYAGHKAAEVGSKAVDLTKEKAAAAAETVVGYTARKKEEAQHKHQEINQGGKEGKRSGFLTEPKRGFGEEYGEEGVSGEDVFGYGATGMVGGPRRNVEEEELYGGGRNERYLQEEGVGEGGGVLGAIGETIAEIAKTTTNLVIGDPPGRAHEHVTTDYMGHEHGHR